MLKKEVCPHCAKEINLSLLLYKKNPFSDLIYPTQWFNFERKFKDYDLIVCPYCHHEYRSNKAKFFGVLKFKHLRLLLLLIILGFLIFILGKDIGIIK